MTKLKTLYVERNWVSSYVQTTILKDENNKVKAIISSSLKQPKFNQKTIVINCWTYSLNWENVERRAKKIKEQKNIKQ